MRRSYTAVASAALLTLTVSCSASSSSAVDLDSLIGERVDVALAHFDETDEVNVIDASPVFGVLSTYDGNPGKDGQWVVGASCSGPSSVRDGKKVELAAVPRERWEHSSQSSELHSEIEAYLSCSDGSDS